MLGKRIRKLREEKEMSQIELGKVISVANSTLSMYESGSREPDYETLKKIASFFDVSTDYLLGQSNTRKNMDLSRIKESEVTYEGKPINKAQVLRALENVRGAAHKIAPVDESNKDALAEIFMDALEKARKLREE